MAFERRHLGNRMHILVPARLERLGVLAAFSERGGGHSVDPYASLNVSYSVGDDARAVEENRRRLIDSLAIPPFAIAGQPHGNGLVRVGAKRAEAGFADPEEAVPGADGLITARARLPLAITTADCVPLVLASAKDRLVMVLHAGWRGLASGIVGKGAARFEVPGDARAAIGPAIGPCHYEVGEDVALAVEEGSGAGAVTERRKGRLFLDLVATARMVLRSRGIRKVENTGLCTACERGRFFSRRRDGTTGRQVALAMWLG